MRPGPVATRSWWTTGALALALGSAPAAGAADVMGVKAQGAGAYFSSVDATGCIVTVVVLSASTETRRPPEQPEGTPGGGMDIQRWDYCQDLFLACWEGTASADELDLRIAGNLGWATLTATFDLVACVGEQVGGDVPAGSVAVDLTWTAVGEPLRESAHTSIQTPAGHYSSHTTGTDREATACGTVIDDTGYNLTPLCSVRLFADIFDATYGQVEVNHP